MGHLWDWTETIIKIVCTKCGRVHEERLDDTDEDAFYELRERDGWYATDKNCYCPECNKKRVEKVVRNIRG